MVARDSVRRLDEFPQSSIGAPIPIVLADEHTAVIAFYLEQRDPNWNGETVRILNATTSDEPIAIVKFRKCYALTFGPPNDEAFQGHSLAERGLVPYGAFLVEHSSWLDSLEKMNAVHPQHNRKQFLKDKTHFVLSFHDSTFECVAEGFDITYRQGSLLSLLGVMQDLLKGAT